MLIGIKPSLPAWAGYPFTKAPSEPEPLKQSRPSGPAGCDFPTRQASTHDLGHIAPSQCCCASPPLSEMPGDPSEKPAVESDREICRVTLAEIVGEPSVDEIKIAL